jgi:hypothetical protein|tara:strand:- start:74 stop:301 length:228 start_codon:yes stop_codon:yes gene_type:complete
MTEPLTKQFTNDTLEEELRTMLVDKNNECNHLKAQIEILEKCVADEQEQKYRALVKAADLKSELNILKSQTLNKV